MYVKIIKSKLPSYWYSDEIGKVYEVEKSDRYKDSYRLVNDKFKYINISDCAQVDTPDTNKQTFNVGDVVLLKSEQYTTNPIYMTVSNVIPDSVVTGYVKVVYFDKNSEIRERVMQTALLISAKRSKK